MLLFDKTGTLTSGVPQLADVEVFADLETEEVLRLAASLDQVSPHVLANAIVRAAREHGLELTFPDDVVEQHGAGIQGTVGGRLVALGKVVLRRRGRSLAPQGQGRATPNRASTDRRACSSRSTVWSPAR